MGGRVDKRLNGGWLSGWTDARTEERPGECVDADRNGGVGGGRWNAGWRGQCEPKL